VNLKGFVHELDFLTAFLFGETVWLRINELERLHRGTPFHELLKNADGAGTESTISVINEDWRLDEFLDWINHALSLTHQRQTFSSPMGLNPTNR
jgi:hypothetical protein